MSIETEITRQATNQARKHADATIRSVRERFADTEMARTPEYRQAVSNLESVIAKGLAPEFERKMTEQLARSTAELAGLL